MGCCSSGRSHSKYSSYVNTIDPSPLQIEFNSSKLFGAIYSEAGIHSTVKHNSKVARESEHSNYFAVTTISSQVNEDSKEEFSALLASENSSIYLEIQAKYLSSQDNWYSYFESEFSIKTRYGSELSPSAPVCLINWESAYKIPTNLLVKFLIDPAYRQQWDSSIVSMETLKILSSTQFTQKTIIKMPLISRELVENKVIRESLNGVSIISYSIDEETDDQAVRAHEYFCISWVTQKKCTTQFRMMIQIDLKLPIMLRSTSFLALMLKTWVKEFIGVLSSLIH